MCALCGVLGGSEHWTDAAARHRVACASRVLRLYGLTLSDWQATSFVLSTATGKTEMVDNLAHLWATAEKLLGKPCDPLDPALIARLEAGGD